MARTSANYIGSFSTNNLISMGWAQERTTKTGLLSPGYSREKKGAKLTFNPGGLASIVQV
jgi:hypothetical protein